MPTDAKSQQQQQLAYEAAATGNKLEEAQTGDKRRTGSGLRTWLYIVMALCFIVASLLVAYLLLTRHPTKNQDQCAAGDDSPPGYANFATKTSYTTARTRLTETHSPAQLPDYFDKEHTLASLHQTLINDKCRPLQLHFYGRHAARYPNSNEIAKLNKGIGNIVDRLASLPQSNKIKDDAADAAIYQNDSSCIGELEPFSRWSSFMDVSNDDQLLVSGFLESHQLARRLSSLYPELFDAAKSDVKFGVTKQIRTSQTAATFLDFIANHPQYCEGIDFDNATSIQTAGNDCYKRFDAFRNDSLLAFHLDCDDKVKNKPNVYYGFKDIEVLQPIADHLSESFKLKITPQEVETIFKICKYESAYKGSSIWCSRFSEDHLKFLEYLDDLDDYLNVAYGDKDAFQTACPLTTDLYSTFESLQENPSYVKKTRLYFTHSQVIEKLFANLVDPKVVSKGYDQSDIKEALRSTTAPRSRTFQTSLIAPFSANIIFSLYDCSANVEPPLSFKVNPGKSTKIIISLNERPLKLAHCNTNYCTLQRMINLPRFSVIRTDKCNLDELCYERTIFN